MSLSAANSPFPNKWLVSIAGLCTWALFLGTQEGLVGSQISSLFSIYGHYLPVLTAVFGVISLDLLLFSLRALLPISSRFQISALWALLSLGLLWSLQSLSASSALICSSAVFLLARYLVSMGSHALLDYKTAAIEVQREVKRIHWPTHAETLKFVGVVAAFVTASSLFWWIVDGVITRALSFLLHILS